MDKLTERELKIAVLIWRGFKDEEIANHMDAGEAEVRNQISGIFEKLCVRTRLELIVYLYVHGLVRFGGSPDLEFRQ